MNSTKSNEPTQSDESTTDDRGETVLSGSRRDFLKKTATVGILGITGLTAAAATSEPVLAADWSGPYRLGDGQSIKFRSRWTGEIRLEGRADTSDYTLVAEAPYENQDSLRASGGVEAGDDLDSINEDHAYGEVNDRYAGSGADEWGFVDKYYYEDAVTCTVTSGVIDIYDRDVYA